MNFRTRFNEVDCVLSLKCIMRVYFSQCYLSCLSVPPSLILRLMNISVQIEYISTFYTHL